MRELLRVASISATLLASGCGSIPEGVFECTRDADCPHSWFCRADNRCYASPGEGMDAGMERDAGADAGPGVDAAVDAGPDTGTTGSCLEGCDDGNVCTDDDCDNATDECVHTANDTECFGSDPCVQTYGCSSERCVPTVYYVDGWIVGATTQCCSRRVVDITTDPYNCGSCGMTCPAGQTCFNRACQNQ